MNGMAKMIAAVAVFAIVVAIAVYTMNSEPSTSPRITPSDSNPSAAKTAGPEVSGPPVTSLGSQTVVQVSGTVKNESGSPLEAATVFAIPAESGGAPGGDRIQATTGSDGKYRFELAAGQYQFTARYSGFREARETRTLVEEPVTIDFDLVSGQVISGHIKDYTGRAVANALVRAFLERVDENASLEERLRSIVEMNEIMNEPGIDAYSDETGYYEIQGLDEANYELRVVATGYTPAQKRQIRAGSTDVDFLLVEGGRISGTVTSGDGVGVRDASVMVYEQLPKDETDIIEIVMKRIRPPLIEVTADSTGRYLVEGVGGDMMYRVVAMAPGHQDTQVENVVVATGGDTLVNIPMDVGERLQGVVYDPSGRVLPGARVKVNVMGAATGSPNAGLVDEGILTDADGRFLFDTLRKGEYRLVVSHPDYATHVETRIQPNGGADLEIQLEVGGAVGGLVVDIATNAPITGAIVTVQDQAGVKKTGVTDATGAYAIHGIALRRKGEANLNVEAEGYARINNEKASIQDGVMTNGVDFALEKNGRVEGIVTDIDGQPVANASVHVRKRQSAQTPVGNIIGSITQSGPDGRFVVDNVTPADECYLVGTHSKHLESNSELFRVSSGEVVRDLTLELRRGGSIEGIVVDDRGQPLADVIVAVQDERMGDIDPASLSNNTRTDASGTFRLGSIEPGEATLIAAKAGYLRTEKSGIQVVEDSASQGVELRLVQGAFFSGVVTDTQGQPIVGATVEILDTSSDMRRLTEKTDTNGFYTFDNLGPDPVRVDVEARGYNKETLHDQPVNTEGNDFTLSRLGGLLGQVVNQRGEAVTQFSVAPSIIQNGRTYRKVSSKTFNVEDGIFSFPGLEPGQYEVVIGTLGFASVTLNNVQVREDIDTDLGRIILTEGGKLGGVVFDEETGDPIRGVRIKVLDHGVFQTNPLGNGGTPRRDRRSAGAARGQYQTGVDGDFLIQGLNVNQVKVEFSHVNYMPITLTLQVDTLDNSIALSRGGLVSGAVTAPNGTPQSGIQLLLNGQGKSDRQVTDRKGHFTFSGLPDGTYTIRIWSFGVRSKEPVGDPKSAPTYTVVVQNGEASFLDIKFDAEEEQRGRERRGLDGGKNG